MMPRKLLVERASHMATNTVLNATQAAVEGVVDNFVITPR
jgi:hypothetical protein